MRLYIAEKPSIAQALTENITDNFTRKNGYFEGQNNIITWCYGHILSNYNPEDYNPDWKIWKKEDLPIIVSDWKLKPKDSTKEQLNVIKSLLENCDDIVNAGDPDREGQLLVDEVLHYFDCKLPVKRLWLAALDTRSVQKALSSMKDNQEYQNLSNSALARSRADWLVGLNATRAMSVLGRKAGYTTVLSQGRVQTPTLNLIVQRDLEIKNFIPVPFFNIFADFSAQEISIRAKFIPNEDSPALNPEGLLVDANFVKEILALPLDNAQIIAIKKEEKNKQAPLPHCLSSLQIKASAVYDMSAQEVLDIAQELYLRKLITYPRTDCQYLPMEQFDDVHKVFSGLAFVPQVESAVKNADYKLRSKAWNTGKITAHHAIIPTGETLDKSFSDKEMKIFQLITYAYLMQFYPDYIYESQRIDIALANTDWKVIGQKTIQLGWKNIYNDDSEDDENNTEAEQALPNLQENTHISCHKIYSESKKTSPPRAFTEGKLIEAMTNIHRFVEDAKAKSILKENEGIGTEATRASIIETLKKRCFIEQNKKVLQSTDLGKLLISLTPKELKDPVTTALWESRLSAILQGNDTLENFMLDQEIALPTLLESLLAEDAVFPPAYPCPHCQKPMILKKFKDKAPFWSCSGYPDCKHSQPDKNGKPVQKIRPVISEHKCKACGSGLIKRKGNTGFFWACSTYPDCKEIQPDDNGKPGEKVIPIISEYKCKVCDKGLIRRKGKSDFFWGCSGYPECKTMYYDVGNQPKY